MRFQSAGNKIQVGTESGRTKISLMRREDYHILYLFIFGLIASFAGMLAAMLILEWSSVKALPVLAAPLFVIGLVNYIKHKRWVAIIIIALLSLAIYYLEPSYVLFFLYVLVCTGGVAVMTEVIQRLVFFRILSTIEFVNLKEKLSLVDRAVTFMFNIPCDLDTRNLDLDLAVKRDGIPWGSMFHSMFLALMVCTFLWMYMVLNPSFVSGESGMSIYTFTIVLYVALLVLPWNLFKSLNVRIRTGYRDFNVYSGLYETIKRMFLPILAILIFMAISLSSGTFSIMYITISIVMIAVIVGLTSVLYYTGNESGVVNDVKEKWSDFHPTRMYAGYEESGYAPPLDEDIPGTPRRPLKHCLKKD